MDGLSSAANVIAAIQLTGSIVKICGGYIQEVKDARDDITSLQRTAIGLEGILHKLKKLVQDSQSTKQPTSPWLVNNISDCLSHLEALQEKINPGRGKRMMKQFGVRALKWPFKRSEVNRIVQDLERYKSSFTLALQVDQSTLLADVARSADWIDQSIGLDRLPIARGAEFDSYIDQHEDECLPGTRTELLRQVMKWAISPQSKCIFWLNGMAGTGKTTISRTVAKSIKEAKSLGASFFFKRGEGDRGNAMKLFPTIARQLALRFPSLMPSLQKAIHNDPDIATKSLKEQFNKLLHEPLLSLELSNQQFHSAVIVIDALDECEDDNDIRVILQSLPRLRESNTLGLRIFLTSRPELPIRYGFSEIANCEYQDFVLQDIPEAVTAQDISLFLKHRLSKIGKDRSLPTDWPGGTNIHDLTRLSAPLFIFAATVCRVLEDPQWDPTDSLANILANTNEGSQLDGTYVPVLNRLLSKQNEKQQRRLVQEFRKVVGSILLLESPLSVASLSSLLGLPKSLVNLRLSSLHSVISVPEDPTLPVRPFHLSFRDFLLDLETRKKTQLWIDGKETHQMLATRCISVCHSLRRNICGLPNEGALRVEIDPRTINHCLTPELQYSCRFWAQHLVRCADLSSLMSDVFSFLQDYFLYWVESMSILGLISEVVGAINMLQTVISDGEINKFLNDAKRFTLKNLQIADQMPLQLYCSGLIFSPRKAMVRGKFRHEFPAWVDRLPEVDESWSAELQTLEGHSSWVGSVGFSPNGQLLASGSSDRTIKLWDTITGVLQQTLEGHLGWVQSVAFSPNGQVLASGSSDQTIKLWDTVTGSVQQTLIGHSDWVRSVSFSADGQLVASGSSDKTVRLWDTATGALQLILKGHLGWVRSVAFSPDGQFLASGSNDQTIMLWNTGTWIPQLTLRGHSGPVRSVSFSPYSRLLASGSSDGTVMLWDTDTGALQLRLEGHLDWVGSVVFSPDGRFLASASSDETVKLWNTSTGTLKQTLEGHTGSARSVAFSPNGQLLACGSVDRMVRLWDIAIPASQKIIDGHSDWVQSVAFSHDGQVLASGSSDKTIKLWNTDTGALQLTLEGHFDWVESVVFSPNGRLLASGSRDATIKIWDIVTGSPQSTLGGHSDWVHSLAFSPCSSVLASASCDGTIRLWDTINLALKQILRVEGSVTYLEFSPDGSTLRTNLGLFHTQQFLHKSDILSTPQESVEISIWEHQWIFFHDRHVLWLPPEFRPRCWAVKCNKLAMGHASGRVSFLGFST